MVLLRQGDIEAQVPNLDRNDVVELAEQNRPLQRALEQYRPPNWWGTGIKPPGLIALARDSGIPVAWVPRAGVLQALVASAPLDHNKVLLGCEDEIIVDCKAAVDECDDEWLDDAPALVLAAIAAYADGHASAAMALAVVVGEALAHWASEPRVIVFESREERDDYEQIVMGAGNRTKEEKAEAIARLMAAGVEVNSRGYKPGRRAATELSGGSLGSRFARSDWRTAVISPIPHFFTPFDPKNFASIPVLASRHVTVHRPRLDHLNSANALRCLLLASSILREQQEFAIEIRLDDANELGSETR